jgi:sulfite reductase (NADPH) flavoprotein alpha-component
LKRIGILIGTQTGNSEGVAREAASIAKASGLTPQVLDMADVQVDQLAGLERVLIVCSTYGEGEMPDNAHEFWDALSDDAAPALTGLPFAVLALGDTNYDLFCEAGRLLDERLAALGGDRAVARLDCDVDYEKPARQWMEELMPVLAGKGSSSGGASLPSVADDGATAKKWSRTNPYQATLKRKATLSKTGSGKEIVHYEIDLGDSGIEYRAGDVVNIFPKNELAYVDALLKILQCSGDETITINDEGEHATLRHALTELYDVRRPSPDLIALFAERSGDLELNQLLEKDDKAALDEYLYGKDTLDLMEKFGKIPLSAAEFCRLSKPIAARAYSISSCPLVHENEVHATIASVRWDLNGREHKGICSTYLADLVDEGQDIGVYFSANKSFRIPTDGSKPIIMVGPGTGIAPFRAFLEEREATEATGQNWLLFGDRTKEFDYIYQDEIEAMQERGVLHRLDLAWSRDQAEKVYVQDKMRASGADLFAWLEQGGYFFVCGDAYRMAKDVDQALHDIIAEHGKLTVAETQEYVAKLKKEKRYVRDVY